MNREEAAKKLRETRLLKSREEVEAFDEAHLALTSTGDPAVLEDLFAAFDDATEQHEVMWGLVHDVESFGLETFMKVMGESAPRLLPHAKEWLTILHERILNSEQATEVYRGIIPTLPERSQEVVKGLLAEIRQARPETESGVRRLQGDGES